MVGGERRKTSKFLVKTQNFPTKRLDLRSLPEIEVLQAVEVMVGDERGFGPERPVTRAEMAVVMGKLLNLDYNYYTAICPFDDVYDWARGRVGACYANGIVSGRGEGVYDPGATVTAVEAASMLMRALGYFQYSNDYAEGLEVATDASVFAVADDNNCIVAAVVIGKDTASTKNYGYIVDATQITEGDSSDNVYGENDFGNDPDPDDYKTYLIPSN